MELDLEGLVLSPWEGSKFYRFARVVHVPGDIEAPDV